MHETKEQKRKYEDVWRTLLRRLKMSIRCTHGLEPKTFIKGIFNEKSLDLVNRKKFFLKARVDKVEKDKVNLELRQKINLLDF